MPRARQAFFSRARSWASVSLPAAAGMGAAARMTRASGRKIKSRLLANEARKTGKY